MAEICCEVAVQSKTLAPCETSPSSARRKRMDVKRFNFITDTEVQLEKEKRLKLEVYPEVSPRECNNAVENCSFDVVQHRIRARDAGCEIPQSSNSSSNHSSLEDIFDLDTTLSPLLDELEDMDRCPKFGMESVIGRRRNMEDAVAIHPSFCQKDLPIPSRLHFFGVYDGHGCSHVATTCRDRLHQLMKEELENQEDSSDWKGAMERSFSSMDEEIRGYSRGVPNTNCLCELKTNQCDAVGSTAVVSIVTRNKVVVANCGDSRAVLCRGGKAVPLSIDHKPQRPDELLRIEAGGGRVIYWDCPRVEGVLAMSRSIGDDYLKPHVSSEPEVTITDRTESDEFLILGSDGLWDVVSNGTACRIVRTCLSGEGPNLPATSHVRDDSTVNSREGSDEACSDAAVLLTKLAIARNSEDNISVVVVDLRTNTSSSVF